MTYVGHNDGDTCNTYPWSLLNTYKYYITPIFAPYDPYMQGYIGVKANDASKDLTDTSL